MTQAPRQGYRAVTDGGEAVVFGAARSLRGSRGTVLGKVAAVGLVLAAPAALVGCGSDEPRETSLPVVSGVVLDGPEGSPVTSGEVELVVLPAALGNSSPDVAGTSTDTASLGAGGAFSLEATPEQLTPHAGADGRVQVEVRMVGRPEVSLRTTVLLRRNKETGGASVVETTDVRVEAASAG